MADRVGVMSEGRLEQIAGPAEPGGNGSVTDRTFLGSLTRISVRLSGDVLVKVDRASTEAADMLPGASVNVSLPDAPVLVAARA
jgi:putative spermidine/putrescine transport system ATP-binding protein